MISGQEFEALTWSIEDDLAVEALVVDADKLLSCRIEGLGAGPAQAQNHLLMANNQVLLPENGAITATSHVETDEQAFRLPELEDIGLVLDRRRYKPTGLSVTDFTGAEWCQQQYALALSAKLPEVRGANTSRYLKSSCE